MILIKATGSNERSELDQYLPDSDILPKNEQELRTTLTTPQFKKVVIILF